MKLEAIEIGVGIGPLRFGMTREEVNSLLGEADEVEYIEATTEDEESSIIWHYDELEVSLSFADEPDWMLVAIATSSEDVQLAGKKVIGSNKESVLKLVAEFGLGDADEEDITDEDGIPTTVVYLYESAMNLWFENNELTEIQWGAIWDEESLN
ncbi:MAG TPA: hypothetical protein DCQ26_06060 [Marinilabiliales bacterium]|nr:MAG: hypothetical protein A2W95_01995 [Bacteroidetes bacterium GWA2_40_14]OFX61937.1 MAG: hypothetical protein A2W84_13180 [Bacteroidetes bacterium GWC2_40_13]OFX74222.1 MAG: hypothetical protein A2W96_12290 [Bacteroidetes bacterium GWD2_40_43]OFX93275.1 MAG: hypothetical protein A2W97_05785 [Bacteroidetes bacterium GWE2_40_63]OFY21611.1 MAG: hypothetical protein A2W88_09785 [Bacteroidetes bacterium GWF2_40_13]OFZ25125.1 MAG: hypothetical protein A2437_05380 [Bacteroidetes bacterium RIFOXYC